MGLIQLESAAIKVWQMQQQQGPPAAATFRDNCWPTPTHGSQHVGFAVANLKLQ